MMHPVKKALNKMARNEYYGFLSHPQFGNGQVKANQKNSGGYKSGGPNKGPEAGGTRVPAKPKGPKPTLSGEKRVLNVR